MGPKLVAIAGPLEGIIVPLDEELSLGRGPSNRLAIADPSVADRQCLIKREGEHFRIWGVDRRSPTFVNGLPASGVTLKDGDHITIGTSLFLVSLEPDAEETATTPLHDLVPASIVRLRREDALLGRHPAGSTDSAARLDGGLRALLKVSTALSAIRGLSALERPLLELIFDAIPAERGAILLTGRNRLTFDRSFTSERVTGRPCAVHVSRAIAEEALRSAVAILGHDVRALDPAEASGSTGPSVLAAPLVAFEDVLGIIYLESQENIPFDHGHLEMLSAIAGIAAMAVDNLRQVEQLRRENRRLQAEINIEHDMVGESPQIREVCRFIAKVAPTDSTVLIEGESGTGKELVARAIHRNSSRAAKPFVAINCAAIAETLLESELFGHEKGAFTGAFAQKPGKLELAEGGTVFFDEIGELPLALQPKLLRVLQQRELDRVGGTRPVKVDVRVVAATNVDLNQVVAAGSFRKDLYYRLNVLSITVPPLRERREDIPALITHFVTQKGKRRITGISPDAEALMLRYAWPGNIRELENVIERAVVLGTTDRILPEDLPEALLESDPHDEVALAGYHEEVNRVKRDLIIKAVNQAGGSYVDAARLLGLQANYLHRLIRNMNLKASLRKMT